MFNSKVQNANIENIEYREHFQNSQMAQQQTRIEKGQVQQNGHKRDLHSDL